MSETDRMTPPLTPNSVRRRAPPAPDIPEQTRALIMAVADKLHMQDGCESFPSVDAVRRLARGCTVTQVRVVMHEWRHLRAEQSRLWAQIQAQSRANHLPTEPTVPPPAPTASSDPAPSELDDLGACLKAQAKAQEQDALRAAERLAEAQAALALAVSRAEQAEVRIQELEAEIAKLRGKSGSATR